MTLCDRYIPIDGEHGAYTLSLDEIWSIKKVVFMLESSVFAENAILTHYRPGEQTLAMMSATSKQHRKRHMCELGHVHLNE